MQYVGAFRPGWVTLLYIDEPEGFYKEILKFELSNNISETESLDPDLTFFKFIWCSVSGL